MSAVGSRLAPHPRLRRELWLLLETRNQLKGEKGDRNAREALRAMRATEGLCVWLGYRL